jgi:LuxR family transcriptional regulator, maltose regulon positive regulatory protein
VDRSTALLIDRGDLLAALDRAAAGKVTIISAPAGSGKTSLLRAWADRPGQAHRLAMLPVKRDQNDAQQFWLGLLGAVRDASATQRAEPLAATPEFNGPAMVDRVLSELTDHHGRFVVVIDDLHELRSDEALSLLTRLLVNLPAHVHAILATRRDLRLRLHRLRLAGELAEIRATDLRFTPDETRELLNASGIALSAAGCAVLHQRTEGWAAGLRLAVLSLAGHPDPERFVAEFSGSDRTVAEYLLAEMLESQRDEVQQLLLRTSLLDRVNGELADLLTGGIGSERILLELEDANAFLMSLDPERTWFRYHQLVGDFLRLEQRRRSPQELPQLHRRAAGWLADHGHVVEAIRHTQLAGDWPVAARMLADHSFSLMLDGQAQTIQALLHTFAREAPADDPELALVHAADDLLHGHLDEATAHLAIAETYVETTPPPRRRRLQVAVVSLKLSLARRRGHLAGVIEQATLAAAPISGQSDEEVALGSELRAVALMNLGTLEAWSLGLEDAEHHLQEGALLARSIGRPYLEVGCLAQLGFASRIRSFPIARQRCREAIAVADQHGWGAEPVIAPALVTMAGNLAWTGEFDEAERWLRRTERALETDAGPGIRQLLHLATGRLHAGRGRYRESLEEFTAAERLQSQLEGPHALASQVTGWILTAQARLGMLDQARAALEDLNDEQANSGEIRNACAAICLAAGDPDEALGALADVLDGTAPVIGYVTVVESQLLAALAYRARGDQAAAHRAVERALALAEPDRLVLPFVTTGASDLLQSLPRHTTAHAAMLADILDVVGGISLTASDPSPSLDGEQLSPTELRVLGYLPTNLSRPEIASELSVSVNTVNTHLRSIYAKLQASNRSSAVQRARELRLLSAARRR